MPKELVISAAPHETRVAILEDGQLCEIYIEREKEFALVGSIYKGRVTRVLPGMQSAFVDIGLDSDAFLYVGDFLENLEDYDHVVAAAEGKVEKMEEQGGSVFAESQPPAPAVEPAAPPSSEAEMPPAASGDPFPADQIGNRAPEFAPPAAQPPRPSRPPTGAPYERQGERPSGQGPSRGPGGFGRGSDRGPDRGPERGGDRGGDRGGRRRGGRWRGARGGGGGRPSDPRQGAGRDLPPAKYTTPRPFISRPYDPPVETGEAYEPIILPGESLAKYKDRAPGAPAAAGAAAPPAGGEVSAEHLPASLYAEPAESAAAPGIGSGFAPEPETAAEIDAEALSEYQALPEEPPRAFESREPAGAPPPADIHAAPGAEHLTEDEVTSLAEQLAEARQEEVADDAETAAEDVGEGHEATPERHDTEDEHEAMEAAASVDDAESSVDDADAAIAEAEEHDDEHGQHDGQHDEQHEDEHEHAEFAAAESHEDDESRGNVAGPHEQQPTRAAVSDPNRQRFQRPQRRWRQRGERGARPPRRDHRPAQAPRRPQLISEMLKAGQEIIVQIAKEPLGKKGARITSHVALPGRFLVYMPTVNHIGVSRRIASSEERSRLRRLVTESKGTFPGGFIVRTAAEGAPDDEIRADVEFLGRTWDKIRTQSEPRKAPSLLHRDLNLVERILRDYVSNDYTAIWIDNEDEFSKVVEFVGRFQPKLINRVKLYTKPTPIFEEFGIQQDLDRALRPKVWLKSGGYIVINHTEALVAIDVNTGKYVGRGSTRLEDTIVKTNLEAVKEIVRQIRLRDLGGIIVLDLIDMEERRNREKVMAALDVALRSDRAPSKALPFNEFGLVTVTRKRTKQSLERVLCQPCPYCTGSGMVKSVPTICYEIQAEARKMAADLDASSITLRVHPEIAKALKTREAALVDELEQTSRKSVIIQADPTLHWEQYDIY